MKRLIQFYKWISKTNALEQTSGKYEMMFFENVYRVTYLAGLSTSDKTLVYLLYGFLVKLLILLLICSEMWNFFSEFNTLDAVIDSINITLIQFIALYKFKCLNQNKHIFKQLASAMEHVYFDTSTEVRQKLLEMWSERNEWYMKLVIGLGCCTLVVWNVYPLVDDVEYNLAVAVRLPIEYQTRFRYPIAYTLVQVAFNYAAGFVMVVDIVVLTHLMHLLCQYTILADCFESILVDCGSTFKDTRPNRIMADRRFQTKYIERLGELVAQHIFILNNTLALKKILSAPMLGQLATSAILISSVGFQVAVSMDNITKFLMSCLFLGYNMCELFIICRWCDDIKFQSAHISSAVYCSGWEGGMSAVAGVRSRLVFVLSRASRPLVLTAGGMYDLSLVSFTDLVKASYSALTVLLRLR